MKEGWNTTILANVATCQIGLTYKPTDVVDEGGIIVLRSNNIQDSKIALNDIVRVRCEINPSKFVKDGDILMCSRNGSFRLVGKVAKINKLAENMSFGAFMTIIRSEYNEYLFYFFQSQSFRKQIFVGQTATINQITTKMLNNTHVNIPPLSEQLHIVEELDLLSSIIEKKKAQLNELDNLAQSLFYEMFGHLYETAFPIKVLIDICEFIKDGTHQTPTYTDDKVNGVKFLSAKDVVSGYINWENVKLIPFELHQELHKRIAPQRNDLLLCKNGTTGICAIVETDEIFDIYVSLALLRPKKPFCPKYLLYAINNPQTKRQFDESLKGIGVPNLHLGEIKKTKIIFPPLELQQQFASKIEAIEHQKELIKQSIKEVETLFNSRMDYYFN